MKQNNSRDVILQCALSLFSAKGYDAVSVSDIVEKAGITKPTLYYFFGSKEGLFRQLLEEHYRVLLTKLEDIGPYRPRPEQYEEDIYPLLLRLVEAHFDFARQEGDFYSMILSLTFAPPTSLPATIAEEHLRLQYGIAEERFREIAQVHTNLKGKERACAWRLMALINAQIGFWRRGHGAIGGEDAKAIVKQFMHGIFA